MSWPLLVLVAATSCVAFVEGRVGLLNTYSHQTSGDVYIKDEKTIVIKNFKYDGKGPDAFFYVGSRLPVGAKTGVMVPYPTGGADKDTALDEFTGDLDVVLTLPGDLKTTDLKWLSVWCRQFKVNFADIKFPDHHHDAAHANPEPENSAPNKSQVSILSIVATIALPIFSRIFFV